MFQSFDTTLSLKVRSIFLDMSKALDKVWHGRLLYKLNSIGISGKLSKLIESYLSHRFQRVVLTGQSLSQRPVLVGVTHGFILEPLLFLTYVNCMHNGLRSNINIFADDASTF